ncbi:ATPase inhibitor [Vermiconidia calcicola]|uniref:ATPase inhibitor n=1 Tax=Vermiconidia calcicola TaxID=1690605 RepID=A0ACC3MKH4_9PEZI|nr:ATPase inhibitor [Vermiconidia calcicola]
MDTNLGPASSPDSSKLLSYLRGRHNNFPKAKPKMSLTRTLTRAVPQRFTTTSTRSFSVAARRMAEGDAGAPRSGGSAQGDAFTKREQASEDYYVKQQEREKLEALRKKIADQEAEIAKDRDEAEKLMKKP